MDVHWFCVYQRVVVSLYYTLSYIFLLPHNLHQLTFLTLPIPEYATPHPDWSFTSPPTVSTANPTSDTPGWGWLLCLILLFRRQIWSHSQSIISRDTIVAVLLGRTPLPSFQSSLHSSSQVTIATAMIPHWAYIPGSLLLIWYILGRIIIWGH